MKFTPNENSYICFIPTLTGTPSGPKVADITSAVNLTPLVSGLTASTTGSALPTPTFDTKFNTSIGGNVDATFSMDGYRDTVVLDDLMWTTFPRGTTGFVIVSRAVPVVIAGTVVEVWPIEVLSRSVPNMTSNTVVTTTVTCAIPSEPDENATVVA